MQVITDVDRAKAFRRLRNVALMGALAGALLVVAFVRGRAEGLAMNGLLLLPAAMTVALLGQVIVFLARRTTLDTPTESSSALVLYGIVALPLSLTLANAPALAAPVAAPSLGWKAVMLLAALLGSAIPTGVATALWRARPSSQ